MQVHDEDGRAVRVDRRVVGRGAEHLGALELEGGALEDARVARVLDDEARGGEEEAEDDGGEQVGRDGERHVQQHLVRVRARG